MILYYCSDTVVHLEANVQDSASIRRQNSGDMDLSWVLTPAGTDMLAQHVPITVSDRIKKDTQVAEMRVPTLHVGLCCSCPQCNYGHGWPAMTAHLLGSQ